VNGTYGGKGFFSTLYTRPNYHEPPPDTIAPPPPGVTGSGASNLQDDAGRPYPPRRFAASVEAGGRSTEGRSCRTEVELAYGAAARDVEHNLADSVLLVRANTRAAELERYFRDGWGELDNDRQGRAMFAAFLHTLANTVGRIEAKMQAVRDEFAPWLPDQDFTRMTNDAFRFHRWWSDDKLAFLVGLNYADRQRLGIRTIGAVDVPKAERDRLREQRKVEAKRAKARAAGVTPREEYEAPAKARRAKAEALGISYEALRKRELRAAAKAACPKSDPNRKREPFIGATLGTPAPAAPPQGFQAGANWSAFPNQSAWSAWADRSHDEVGLCYDQRLLASSGFVSSR